MNKGTQYQYLLCYCARISTSCKRISQQLQLTLSTLLQLSHLLTQTDIGVGVVQGGGGSDGEWIGRY